MSQDLDSAVEAIKKTELLSTPVAAPLPKPDTLTRSKPHSLVAGELGEHHGLYIPAFPTLGPNDILRRTTHAESVFPFTADAIYFYAARSGIYHLMRALGCDRGAMVLMPDYHSGVEVWAVRSAGACVQYYHVRRDLTPDLNEIDDLARRGARVLYAIHYIGWPQPIREMRALCQKHGMILIEDCALSLLSEFDGRPLGDFGDYSVFCLYKTLPVPNGGMLVQNQKRSVNPELLELKPGDRLSTLARVTELMFLRMRSRSELCGRTMLSAKVNIGKVLTSLGVSRLPVGDISPEFGSEGYEIKNLTIEMSPLSKALLKRFDYKAIYRQRRQNYLQLQGRLKNQFTFLQLPDGVCPLFFPLLVRDKATAATALRARGIEATEFWNFGHPEAREQTSKDAQFLRSHLLELPIHQDVTAEQIDYLADQVLRLRLFL